MQGHGTEIVDISTIQRLNSLTSLPESLIEKGYEVTIQGDYIKKIIPVSYTHLYQYLISCSTFSAASSGV